MDSTAASGTLTLNSGVVLSTNTWNFGGAGSNTYEVTGNASGAGLQSVASNDTISFNNYNTGLVTISAPILANGTNAVNVNGTGTTVLSGANTYTDATTISGGTLQLGAGSTSGSLSTNSVISVGYGATFAVNRSNTVTQGTDFSGAAITGTGGLTQSGSGTTILTTANTYTGATTISAGTLQLGAGSISGSLSTSSVISVGYGATFAVNRSNTVTQGTDFSGAAITGAGGLTQSGSGTSILNAANTYTDVTTITAGILAISNSNARGTSAGGTTVSLGAQLRLDGNGLVVTEPLTISGSGLNSMGALNNNAGVNTYSGLITVDSTTGARIKASNASTLNLTGGVTGSGLNPTLVLTASSSGGASAINVTTTPLNLAPSESTS